jgi:hypothetical protein
MAVVGVDERASTAPGDVVAEALDFPFFVAGPLPRWDDPATVAGVDGEVEAEADAGMPWWAAADAEVLAACVVLGE